jgi:hypothetical protein
MRRLSRALRALIMTALSEIITKGMHDDSVGLSLRACVFSFAGVGVSAFSLFVIPDLIRNLAFKRENNEILTAPHYGASE